MINFKLEKSMYDKFIDKKELTTKELLELGFNSHDLTKLVEDGKIRRVKRGVYDLDKCDGLFTYALVLTGKKTKDFDRYKQAIRRCLEIEPDNGRVHTKVFLDSLYSKDFNQAIESIRVLSNGEKEAYNRDANLWLYMLSFMTELPEDLRDKVSKLKLEDVLTVEDDLRYEDRLSQNKIRNYIMSYKFSQADDLFKEDNGTLKKKPIYISITEKLLDMVKYYDIKNQTSIYDLILQGKYEEVRDKLTSNLELHGLSNSDKEILMILEDLFGVVNEKKIPKIDNSPDSNYLFVEIQKHNYERTLKLFREHPVKKPSRSVKSVGVLLEVINEEISKLKRSKVEEVVVEETVSKEVEVTPRTLSVGSNVFAGITNSLQVGDVDKAFSLLDQYLESIGKRHYKNYIANLIKLDVMNGDKAFVESMHELSCISRERPVFDVAVYIQDFYFNLVNKDYKKAAVYLNLISMSKVLGGVEVDVSQMRRTLIDEAFKGKIKESDLGLINPEDINYEVEEVPTSEAVSTEVVDKVVEPVAEEVKIVQEDLPVVYTLADAIEDVLENDNLLMLEPMSDEEIALVVNTTQQTGNVQSVVIEEENGDKRVVLRYVEKGGIYIDISGTLRLANFKYRNGEYLEAIDLYQSVLPKLDKPKSFIYAKLGMAYRNTTYDGDYSKAIDYLTMATAVSAEEEEVRDYTDLINKLKFKTNYNGVVLTKK